MMIIISHTLNTLITLRIKISSFSEIIITANAPLRKLVQIN